MPKLLDLARTLEGLREELKAKPSYHRAVLVQKAQRELDAIGRGSLKAVPRSNRPAT